MIKERKQEQKQKSKNENKAFRYNPAEIEQKWQKRWEEENLYRFKMDLQKQTYYNLVELPYPSGDLHLGHWFSFVTADVHARAKKMQGKNVFFPNGFDAFGLPAENAAIKRGIHPQDWTLGNIKTMLKQFETMGTMIDWSHQAITCLPEYYKWNQWIFLKMFEKLLAYRGKALSNWCPKDQTVLANEHIEGGKCWRCGSEVIQKEVAQWFLKITAYADKLIWSENSHVDWPKSVKEGQNNWIGRKEGINITYKIEESDETVTVFTTRPDTNFGATFIALSPENKLVYKVTKSKNKKEVEKYIQESKKKTELERVAEDKEKTGVFTGSYAINGLSGFKMPIWVSDFVLSGYGTGALVGVPGHDMRDFQFAKKFGLEIKRVVIASDQDRSPITESKQIREDEGRMVNSDFLNGLDIHEATKKMMNYMEQKGWGKRVTTYHLRDWSISRQRYWGTPVPMIHCKQCGIVPVPYDRLPVELPYDVDFTPKGVPPLASNKKWLKVKCPKCGGKAERDPETLDTFFDSSWYYYRYLDPHYEEAPFDTELADKFMPVDVYYGGAEHTLGHTLYARFFTKFFKDLNLVNFEEFAKRRVQHGVILGPDGNRMSKSKGNVVNPDELVREFGTDTVRTYLCFMMPYEATAPWSPDAIWGVYRFLKRVWEMRRMLRVKSQMTIKDIVYMNKTIKKVEEDIQEMKFNTAVATLMAWINHLESKESISEEEYKNLLLLLAPFAPHMTEELWQNIFLRDTRNFNKNFDSIHKHSWPVFDNHYLEDQEISIAVQINGKTREIVKIQQSEFGIQNEVEKKAKISEKVKKYLANNTLKRTIYVPGKVINFVVK